MLSNYLNFVFYQIKLKGVKSYQSQRFENGHSSSNEEAITIEKPLRILINNDPFTVTMRTPGMDQELVNGLLFNEDIVGKKANIEISYSEDKEIDTADIHIPEQELKDGYMNARNFLSVSSCGVCGKTALPEISGKLKKEMTISHEYILKGLDKMRREQSIFEKTGGCHAAAVLDEGGHILTVAEDIGRHNAVDKVIGSLLIRDELKSASVLLVSGRISYEIVIKCFRAGIPVLAAVSAPSSLAIDYAKELGITVFAFCRDTRLTRFA